MLESVIGALVWTIANVVYVDMKRKGAHGFGRICAFWMGLPATVVWLFAVPEGRIPALRPPPDDEEALLAEIRRDRWLRSRGDRDPAEAPSDEA